MESVVFIFSLIDCCALIFLSVYFVSARGPGGAGRTAVGGRRCRPRSRRSEVQLCARTLPESARAVRGAAQGVPRPPRAPARAALSCPAASWPSEPGQQRGWSCPDTGHHWQLLPVAVGPMQPLQWLPRSHPGSAESSVVQRCWQTSGCWLSEAWGDLAGPGFSIPEAGRVI